MANVAAPKPGHQEQSKNIQTISHSGKSLDVFSFEKYVETLLDCSDEKQVVELALDTVYRTTSVKGASFLPFNPWAQLLSPVLLGEVPNDSIFTLEAYSAQVELREKCKACGIRIKDRDCTLLPAAGKYRIVCRKISIGEQQIGVANFYFPISGPLPARETKLIESVLLYAGKFISTLSRKESGQNQHLLANIVANPTASSIARTMIMEAIDQLREIDTTIIMGLDVAPGLHFSFCGISPPLCAWEQLLTLVGRSTDDLPDGWLSHYFYPIWAKQQTQLLAVVWAKGKHAEHIKPQSIEAVHQIARLVELATLYEMELSSNNGSLIFQERERLAREIHDGFAQTLAFLLIQMKRIEGFEKGGEHEKFVTAYKETHQTISEAYVDIREAIDNLRSTSRSPFDVMIRSVVTGFCNKTNIQCALEIEQPSKEINELSAVHAVRIIQEALTNARKHANATKLAVRGFNTSDHFVVEVEDNGIGLLLDPEGSIGKYGLRSMRERAGLINANLLITTTPEKGTKIALYL